MSGESNPVPATWPEGPVVPGARAPEELVTLARGIFSGRIFTDRHIPTAESQHLKRVFLPLGVGLWEDKSAKELETIGLVYQHLSKSVGQVEGYPTFEGFELLNRADAEDVYRLVSKFLKATSQLEQDFLNELKERKESKNVK